MDNWIMFSMRNHPIMIMRGWGTHWFLLHLIFSNRLAKGQDFRRTILAHQQLRLIPLPRLVPHLLRCQPSRGHSRRTFVLRLSGLSRVLSYKLLRVTPCLEQCEAIDPRHYRAWLLPRHTWKRRVR